MVNERSPMRGFALNLEFRGAIWPCTLLYIKNVRLDVNGLMLFKLGNILRLSNCKFFTSYHYFQPRDVKL